MSTIFTKIINKEIPADIVYEDDELLAFNDVAPQAPIHILIIPKKEIATLNDLKIEDSLIVGKMLLLAKDLAKKYEINQTGYLRKENNRGFQGLYLDGNYLPSVGYHRLSLGLETGLYRTLYDERYFTNWATNNPQLILAKDFEEQDQYQDEHSVGPGDT